MAVNKVGICLTTRPRLQQANFHAAPFDFSRIELLHGLQGNIALDRHKRGEFGHVDLADLLAGVAGVSRQGPQHVAGANLFLAATQNLQRDHGREAAVPCLWA